ncbi:MAG: hypothetical protein WCX93_06615, partial [Burkholderiaceae bacterium]
LGVGSTFTQQDIDSGNVIYRHGGDDGMASEWPKPEGEPLSYHDKFHFVVSDGVATDTGEDDDHNIFMIQVMPTNDAPVVTAPSGGPISVEGDAGNVPPSENKSNLVPGFEIFDPDIDGTGFQDEITVIVRLLDKDGNAFVAAGSETEGRVTYDDIEIKVGSTYSSLIVGDWDGDEKYLVLRGNTADVNDALDSLRIVVAPPVLNSDTNTYEGPHENQLYQVQVIADDRLRDDDGVILTNEGEAAANGGQKNQSSIPGGEPIDIVHDSVYDLDSWYAPSGPDTAAA